MLQHIVQQSTPSAAALLADGALGTELQKRGLPPGTPADRWSLENPAAVAAVHAAYVAAGSDVVLTNTLNANHAGLAGWDAARIAALNREAVALARGSGARWVVASLGPGADAAQVGALAGAGVDGWWIETQLALADATRIVRLCEGPLPCLVSFSFHRADGLTQAGETAAEVARQMEAAGVTAVGVNCGAGLEGALATLTAMAEATTLPLLLKPNAGVPALVKGRWHYPLAPVAWATAMAELRGMVPQLRVMGGCCGTTPAHIARLAATLAR